MVIVRDFSGKLNMDASPYRFPPGDWMDSLNITRDAQRNGSDGPISNIVGNRLVSYTFPSGTNKCIGAKADPLRNRVIEFIWNSNGFHSILKYDNATRARAKILESKTDSGGVDILNFQLSSKVNDVNIIHRDEDGDLLFWNDAYNNPCNLNIDLFEAGTYTPVTSDLIRVAKIPPSDELLPVYQTDTNNNVNNFKKKLLQYCYSWGFKDGTISTVSPFSKTVLPLGASDIEIESNPSQNNTVILQVVGGPADYSFVRIYMREWLGAGWGDWVIVDTLDRDDYSISPGGTYNYKFLNDGQYPFADQRYMDLQWDRVAAKCNSQTIVNGNVLVQAGITDGYDPMRRADVNVQITSELKDTEGSSVTPANPTVEINIDPGFVDFNIGPSVSEGCIYNLKLTWNIALFFQPTLGVSQVTLVASYEATALDDRNSVADALIVEFNNYIAAHYPTLPGSHATHRDGVPYRVTIDVVWNSGSAYNIVHSATAPNASQGATAIYKWNVKKRYGIVYKDKDGKSNGVVSFVSTEGDPNDFSVTTPDFNFDATTGNPKVPIIKASINHLPPSWATSYSWVRTANESVSMFLQYITAEVVDEAGYYYFCIENLPIFKADNTGFIPSYIFQSGDRVRIYAEVFDASPFYTIPANVQDYEILGTVQRNMTGGSTAGLYLKVKKPPSGITYTSPNVMIEIYRPALRSSDETQVFYGFGETYGIYTGVDGVRYHVGEDQNQDASNPATFTFEDGDVYYKFRDFYKLNGSGIIDPTTVYSKGVMDVNYSDYWASAVNSNGNPWVIDPNAKLLYNPVEVRFSQPYQPGTDINGLNRFYPEDFEEAIRSYGDIMKIFPQNNLLIACQKLKIGAFFVDQQMTYNVDGTSNLILSSKLLNTIQYYQGEFGIGDCPESVAIANEFFYGIDNLRGVIWRKAQNGIVPISILNNINNFAVTETKLRGFDHKIYGVFDTYTNLYIAAFEAAGSSPAKTLVWNEAESGFESPVSYQPEMMCCLNNLLITWKNGQLYTHDSETHNQFYGVDYPSLIKVVFGDSVLSKKTWENMMQQGNVVWSVPEITTSVNSYDTTPQQSNLVASDFADLEGFFHANLLRDANTGGVATGDVLKGAYLIATFRIDNAGSFVFLNCVAAGAIESQLNNKQ